jgi:phospholipid/cholesterol/gamma-HCH transport system substrate-binding protein
MGKQFIERNALVIGVITAILIVVTLYVSLTLTREDLTGGYTITARFTDANGLRPGDVAIIAGIPAGKVTSIDIPEGQAHVEAAIQVDGGIELPATTRATITLRTLVGKRAVDLDTGTDFDGPLLEEGDVIPLERTSVTIDVPQLAESADDLLGDIDSEALNLLLTSVADVTRGQRERVADLIDSGSDLTELVNTQEQQIRTLLRNLADVSATLSSRDDELIGIIDDLDVALGNLAARRADLQALLRETQRTGALTADFVSRARADLDAILDELHLDLQIIARHQVDLAEGLAYGGDALIGFGSIAFATGVPVEWGHVFVTSAGPVGVDALVGCGGLVDQQLDALLGPDPRPCSEQSGGDSFPDDLDGGGGPLEGSLIPDLPFTSAAVTLAPQRLPIDVGPRSLLEALDALQDAGGGS